jgi:hypothetical protein
MPDGLTVAAVLLVAGPVLCLFGFYDTGLYRVWTAPRDEHLALVAAHRRGWTMLNVGFTVATVLTAGGLIVLAASLAIEEAPRAVLVATAVSYTVGGVLWCAVLAIRTRTTPALAGLVAAGSPTEPAETLLGAATGSLFVTFCGLTSLVLVAMGATLALGGGVAAPVAWFATLVGALTTVWLLVSGDIIPAVLYLPTLLIGVALLLGWT